MRFDKLANADRQELHRRADELHVLANDDTGHVTIVDQVRAIAAAVERLLHELAAR